MEIVVVVFLCVWVTACGLLAYGKIRKDFGGGEKREDRRS